VLDDLFRPELQRAEPKTLRHGRAPFSTRTWIAGPYSAISMNDAEEESFYAKKRRYVLGVGARRGV